jgi:hypothetical protein
MFEKYPKLVVSSPEMIKVNKSVSYMSFILKELCDFFMAKTSHDVPVYRVKVLNDEINLIKSKCEKLENFLK